MRKIVSFLSVVCILGSIQNCNAMEKCASPHDDGYLFKKIRNFTRKRHVDLKDATLELSKAIDWAKQNGTIVTEFNARNDREQTPLLYAISINSYPAVVMLLASYRDIDLQEALACAEANCKNQTNLPQLDDAIEIVNIIKEQIKEETISDEEMAKVMFANRRKN